MTVVGPCGPRLGEHPHLVARVADRAHDLGTSPVGAIQIDEDQIDQPAPDRLERLGDIGDRTEHADGTPPGKGQQQALGEARTLVDDEHADTIGHLEGIGTGTRSS